MRRIFSLTLLFLIVLSVSAKDDQKQLDSLLTVLDKSIAERNTFTNNKLHVIKELETQAHQTTSDDRKFMLYGQLFDEYKNLQMDSAYVVANKRLQIADKIENELYKDLATLNLAEVMMVTGMYKETLDILNTQDRNKYNEETLAYIYHLYHSLYMLMSEYSFLKPEKEYYKNLEYTYKDSILSIIDPQDIGYSFVESSKLVMDGKYDAALKIAEKIYHENMDNNRTAAMITHTMVEIYAAKGDMLNMKKYLALSSIYDMRSGVKEYMSLPELAALLYEEGDIDRAYLYMKCSMEDAIFCKARLRMMEISRMLPIINATYDIKMKQEKERLVVFLLIIIVLAVVLFVATLYIYKKLKELAAARHLLKNTNEELRRFNDDLKKLNEKLSEANHVKQEYISYVFTMCSAYIDKLEDFRKKVSRKIKAGQTEELYKETKSNTFVNDELKEFYKSFDSIFLNLYPNFIDDFNSLLQDDERIYPKEGELLSPELRIYALVRLGIGDSVKIASFLHYSPQTVYNYRLKVRNKAKVQKEDFPSAVKKLGQISK